MELAILRQGWGSEVLLLKFSLRSLGLKLQDLGAVEVVQRGRGCSRMLCASPKSCYKGSFEKAGRTHHTHDVGHRNTLRLTAVEAQRRAMLLPLQTPNALSLRVLDMPSHEAATYLRS